MRRSVVVAGGDERVRVGRRLAGVAALLLRRRRRVARLAVVVAQVVALQRLGERQLLRVADTFAIAAIK